MLKKLSLSVILKICLFFAIFEPGDAYKGDAYKKTNVYLGQDQGQSSKLLQTIKKDTSNRQSYFRPSKKTLPTVKVTSNRLRKNNLPRPPAKFFVMLPVGEVARR